MTGLFSDANREDSVVTIVEIDFELGTPDPARVFRAMAGLIQTLAELDRDLAGSIAVTIRPTLILDGIEAGSIRSKLRTVIEALDDEGLKNLDWRPFVGQYLVKGKLALLRRLRDKPTISSSAEIGEIQRDLRLLAESTDVATFPHYAVVPARKLLGDLTQLGQAVANLLPSDRVTVISGGSEVPVNVEFRLTDEMAEELLTSEVHQTETVLTLMVKKPDYLGDSMWELRYGDRTIPAKILDEAWLKEFQAGRVDLKPRDSIKALIRARVKIGADGGQVGEHFSVVKVIGVREYRSIEQQLLLPGDDPT